MDITWVRGNQTLAFHVMRCSRKRERSERAKSIGWGFLNKEDTVVKRLPFVQAVGLSLQENRKYSLLLLELAKKLVQGKSRPAWSPALFGIAQGWLCGAAKGWTPLLALTSGISLNLGVFNLLPIPILDGGVIFFLLFESLMGRDISLHIKERADQATSCFWCCSRSW